jgi:predicted MPP superfamily phosphohydrolase
LRHLNRRRGGFRRGGLARRAGTSVAALAAGGLAWGWFEGGWVRLRECRLELPGLPAELEGLRIAHLSDFHLGVPSRGEQAVRRAVDWVEARRPDLTCITGDLLTRPAGEPLLRELTARLPRCFVVLGNHDFGDATDPFSQPTPLDVDPRTARGAGRWPEPDRDADLRILLCHFPRVIERLRPGDWHLVLAGHMHAGQIVMPWVTGRLHLAHPGARYTQGVYRQRGAVLHVSPGLGTTFVPFRFLARPEATELVLATEPEPS